MLSLLKKLNCAIQFTIFTQDNLPTKFPHTFRKFIAFVERFGIQFVEFLFLVDECRFEQVKGAKIKNLVYIYNSPPDHFSLGQKHHSRDGKSLKLFYAGLIHNSRGLGYVINAIRDLSDVKLVIAGTVSDTEFLKNLSMGLNKNIQYIGHIPYEKVIEITMESDLLFAFYDPVIPNNRYASPNKLFEAMMCGKPIIMNSETTASGIVLEEKCGLVVPYGDTNAIKEAILRIKNQPDLGIKLGENGRKAYEIKYSWAIMERRLIDTYKKIS